MFGSHLSIAGSMCNALREAETLGLDCVQVFTKNQQQWAAPPLKADAIAEWKSEVARLGWDRSRLVSHASYLINLASPDPVLREKSLSLMRDELQRCITLDIGFLVFHPGAFTTSTLAEGIERIAAAVALLINETKGAATVMCFENVAGAGSTIGRRFEELAELRARVNSATGAPQRSGFCIDSCHAHAAGYDLATAAGAQAAQAEMRRVLGAGSVRVMHLNDSKGAAGSHLDRHEHIGKGTIGLAGFAAIVNDREFDKVPKIMETPKDEPEGGVEWDTVNVTALRGLVGRDPATLPPPAPRAAAAVKTKPLAAKKSDGKKKPAPAAKNGAKGQAGPQRPANKPTQKTVTKKKTTRTAK